MLVSQFASVAKYSTYPVRSVVGVERVSPRNTFAVPFFHSVVLHAVLD